MSRHSIVMVCGVYSRDKRLTSRLGEDTNLSFSRRILVYCYVIHKIHFDLWCQIINPNERNGSSLENVGKENLENNIWTSRRI